MCVCGGEEGGGLAGVGTVLRRIFGPKSQKVIGGGKKLFNEELRNLYCTSY